MLDSLKVNKEFDEILPKRSLTKIRSMEKPTFRSKKQTEILKLVDSSKKLPKVGMFKH